MVRVLLRAGQNLPGIEKGNHASRNEENCLFLRISSRTELRMKVEEFILFLSRVKTSFLSGGQRTGSSLKKGVTVILFSNYLILFKPYIFWVPHDIIMGGK